MDGADAHDVRLLGPPAVRPGRDRTWTEIGPSVAGAVLTYVAFQGRWVSRSELAALLWPDRPEPRALGNLRPLLWRLCRDPLAPGFERERVRVRWRRHTDVTDYHSAVASADWRTAWRVSSGELLQGFTIPGSPEFESWLALERTALKASRRTVGLRLADQATLAGRLDEAAEVLASLALADEYDEGVLRRLMTALAADGRRGEAVEAYQRFRSRCEGELGMEPEPDTLQLARSLGSEAGPGREPTRPRGRGGGDVPGSRLPAPTAPFVGRDAEVDELLAWLADPERRFVNLVGPGGIGKTRLAIEVARRSAASGHDIVFVDLTTAADEESFLAAVWQALDLTMAPVVGTTSAMAGALDGRPRLLVLDNVEHIATVGALVTTLLQAGPWLSVLATSRHGTGSAEEWVFPLSGLSCRSTTDASVAVHHTAAPSAAAALFAALARRLRPRGSLAARDQAAIERICARVEGSPLALELAAAWLRVLEVAEIDDQLGRDPGFLACGGEHPPRHRDLRTVFDRSWALLVPREQRALGRLSVFRGGFGLELVRDIAGVELPVILALVNKSLLRRDRSGRFTFHPLVEAFARDRARDLGQDLSTVARRHAHHFLAMVAGTADAYRANDGGRLLHELDADAANVVEAWRWAVRHRDEPLLTDGIEGLALYLWSRGRFDLRNELLEEAAAVATPGGMLEARILIHRSLVECYLGDGDYGRSAAYVGIDILRRHGSTRDLATAFRILAQVEYRHREWDAGLAAAVEGRAYYLELDDREGELVMAMLQVPTSRTAPEAVTRYAALIESSRSSGLRHPFALALTKHAAMALIVGAFTDARRSIREALRLHDAKRVRTWTSYGQLLRIRLDLALGRLSRVEASCRRLLRARASREGLDGVDVQVVASMLLARADLARGDVDRAHERTEQACTLDVGHHSWIRGLEAPELVMVRVMLERGDGASAADWLEAAAEPLDPRWWGGPHDHGASDVLHRALAAEVALARGDVDAAGAGLARALVSAAATGLLAPGMHALAVAGRVAAVRGDVVQAEWVRSYVAGHPRAPLEARLAAVAGTSAVGDAWMRVRRDDGVGAVADVFTRVAESLDRRRDRSGAAPGRPRVDTGCLRSPR